jgi:hypothetical protein
LNQGTNPRVIKDFKYDENRKVDKWNKHPNTGFRGRIAPRNFFSLTSHSAMRKASEELTQLMDQLIKQEMK